MEFRSTAAIVADLLLIALDKEWSGEVFAGGDYYEPGCEECGAFRDIYNEKERRNIYNHKEHKHGCKVDNLIKEARAFIAAENEIASSKGLDQIEIP
jgi:hypothetical protein